MQKFCPNYSGLAYEVLDVKKRQFARLRCKMWQCTYCWRVNRSQWRAALLKQLPKLGNRWSFHTITLPGEAHESRYTAWLIKKNWDKLAKRLKRLYGKFSYVRVLEQHTSGEWHIHLLASFTIPDDDMRSVYNDEGKWRYNYSATLKREVFPKCGFGNICSVSNLVHDVDESATQKAIMYVTKYMTKRDDETESDAKHVGIRMIQTSRDIKFKPEKTGDWHMKSGVYLEDIYDNVAWHDINREMYRVSYEDFIDTYIYPPENK